MPFLIVAAISAYFFSGAVRSMSFLSVIVAVLFVWLTMVMSFRFLKKKKENKEESNHKRRRALVIVGGDFARSPRMQYHAVSLADCGAFHQVVGIGLDFGNKCCEGVLSRIHTSPNTITAEAKKGNGGGEIVLSLISRKQPAAAPQSSSPRFLRKFQKLFWIFNTMFRVLFFILQFTYHILYWMTIQGNVSLILVQTPPAVPFLPIIQWILWCQKFSNFLMTLKWSNDENMTKLIVDWHNFGYTLLEIDHRPKWIVQLYQMVERYCGCGDANFTVSEAMKQRLVKDKEKVHCFATAAKKSKMNNNEKSEELEKREGEQCNNSIAAASSLHFNLYSSQVEVLHDSAPSFFSPCSISDFYQHVVIKNTTDGDEDEDRQGRNSGEIPWEEIPAWFHLRRQEKEGKEKGEVRERQPLLKGLLITSSTSWTSDDDYTIVVEALKKLDKQIQQRNSSLTSSTSSGPPSLFHIWLVCTGKGETRCTFESQVVSANFSPYIHVTTIYFQSFQNYAKMLGVSDIGLSLHRSSSGLDLPMKVVDMFGCGLPVLALEYASLGELVDENSGWVFQDAESLSQILTKLMLVMMTGDANDDAAGGIHPEMLFMKRKYVQKYKCCKWQETWNSVAFPVIQKVIGM